MNMNHAMIIGATGITGGYLLRELASRSDWTVTGLCRNPPAETSKNVRWVGVDLLDTADAQTKLGGLGDTTHIFYCGFLPLAPNELHLPANANVAANLALLTNAVAPVMAAAKGLRHIQVMQGTKYYGSHIGAFKTPAKEDDPRHMAPNFYFDQQDYVAALQVGKSWTWSCLRPHAVSGFTVGNPMNLLAGLAAYAAISKELGLPLKFPGHEGHYRAVYQVTDAGLLARAAAWAATTPACANQAFNITNGDYFRWESLWPRIAELFDMRPGPVQTIDLVSFMADKAPLWDRMIARHDLMRVPFAKAVNWGFLNYVFKATWDQMSDTTRARKLGFTDCYDSEERILEQLAELKRIRFVPDFR
jgi:nucleoside-diphosphate-sugar epimerase